MLWARTAVPSTGTIMSLDPSENVTCTEATSEATETATHQTGAPSTTPNAPDVIVNGSDDALAPLVDGVDMSDAVGRSPSPTATVSESSISTEDVASAEEAAPCVSPGTAVPHSHTETDGNAYTLMATPSVVVRVKTWVALSVPLASAPVGSSPVGAEPGVAGIIGHATAPEPPEPGLVEAPMDSVADGGPVMGPRIGTPVVAAWGSRTDAKSGREGAPGDAADDRPQNRPAPPSTITTATASTERRWRLPHGSDVPR
jgi:hypothetical protein